MNKPVVLVVDDELDIRRSIVEYLKNDFHSLEAESGAEALEILGHETVDVVLTDFNMQNVDGLELVKSMHERSASLPVIVMTGRGSQELQVQAHAFDIFEYIEKPFDLRQLKNSLKKSLMHHRDQENPVVQENFVSKMKYEEIRLKLPKEIAAELREQSQIQGLSVSAYIERLIEERFKHNKDRK